MKKTIVITMLMLVLSAMSALAYTSYSGYGNSYGSNFGYGNSYYGNGYNTGYSQPGLLTNSMPAENPYYANYVEQNSYLRESKFRKAIHRFAYQDSISPYLLVRSPYGKKPWIRPYGDNGPANLVNQEWNPFYGFPYVRNYDCHSAFACHYHNKFPGN